MLETVSGSVIIMINLLLLCKQTIK